MLIDSDLTGKIINECIEVHNELGNGFLEPVYQEALAEEFTSQGIPFEREKLLPIMYKGKILQKEYFADFVCYGDIILENMRKNLSVKYKEVQCIECGNWFITSIYNSKVCRCRSCQREYREKYKNQYNVKYYALNRN